MRGIFEGKRHLAFGLAFLFGLAFFSDTTVRDPALTDTYTPYTGTEIKSFATHPYLQPIQASAIREITNTNPKQVPPEHTTIATTYWIGEGATAENDFISNVPSAWDANAPASFGGIDIGARRNFIPKHNTFYVALPAAEFDTNGLIPASRQASPWIHESPRLTARTSLFKGRWVQVSKGSKTIYAQWHDVGPNEERDYAYVFGTALPRNTFGQRAGIDLSPDATEALGFNGSTEVTWQFVDAANIPHGPWKRYPPIDTIIRW